MRKVTLVLVLLLGYYALAFGQEKTIDVMDTLGYQYEYIPDVPYDTIAARLDSLENEIPLHLNEIVRAFIDYFSIRNRDYTRMIMQRKDIYFPIFEKKLAEHGLPDELKYLSIIESGLNTRAKSRVGALGLWQFMPYTGKIFKLHQDLYIDERMDPAKATEAACQYLKQLYMIFGDWELALASYNAGPGNVRRALRRSGKDNFWDAYHSLPRETRSYLPQFVAIIYVLNHAEDHNIFIEDKEYLMAADTIFMDGYCHLPTLANYLGVCPEDLADLNPEIKQNFLPQHSKKYP
ncbi:MAG: lytic transglycosylase domain-containing protein, partial [Cyclobacteriaceae bacterium]